MLLDFTCRNGSTPCSSAKRDRGAGREETHVCDLRVRQPSGASGKINHSLSSTLKCARHVNISRCEMCPRGQHGYRKPAGQSWCDGGGLLLKRGGGPEDRRLCVVLPLPLAQPPRTLQHLHHRTEPRRTGLCPWCAEVPAPPTQPRHAISVEPSRPSPPRAPHRGSLGCPLSLATGQEEPSVQPASRIR